MRERRRTREVLIEKREREHPGWKVEDDYATDALPGASAVNADQDLLAAVDGFLRYNIVPTRRGTTWTTDAPFRETRTALAIAEAAGAVVVEMEAAALYALAVARDRPVICFAHVTNMMGVAEGDFEKGPYDGAVQALSVITSASRGWFQYSQQPDQ